MDEDNELDENDENDANINNSPSKKYNSNPRFGKNLKRKASELKSEFDNKLRESAMQQRRKEEEDREITNKYFEAATEAQKLKAELLRAKIALTMRLHAQNSLENSGNGTNLMNNNNS